MLKEPFPRCFELDKMKRKVNADLLLDNYYTSLPEKKGNSLMIRSANGARRQPFETDLIKRTLDVRRK